MAYLYDDIATTQTGTITYKRKKHFFKSQDLLRITKTVHYPADILQMWAYLQAAVNVIEELRNVENDAVRSKAAQLGTTLTTYMNSAEEFEAFGGGEFGGGGASGLFQLPFPVWVEPTTEE